MTSAEEFGFDSKVESLCLHVSKKNGELALNLLTKFNLLNKKLSLKTDGSILSIPISRKPGPKELNELESALGMQSLSLEKFQTRGRTIGRLEAVLSNTIPEDLASLVSKSFDIIGDIAIIELSPAAKPFEKQVAQALVKVHKNVRAVFSKAGAIAGDDRVRPLHHILGEDRTTTIHKELGCRFKVDLSKAFFSPRLSTEHQRIAEQVQPGECVVDMFSGVGPFSVMIARRLENVGVHAIDRNPDATDLITENARLNKAEAKVIVWTGDARDIVRDHLVGKATRVIMNHPSVSRIFLEAAGKALCSSGGIVHYYTFADGPDCESMAEKELADGLSDSPLKVRRILATHKVRGVGPMKWQVVVDAKLAA